MKSPQHLLYKILKQINMKRVIINLKQIGLVYKRGEFNRFLKPGSHWLGFGEELTLFNRTQIYYTLEDMAFIANDKLFYELITTFQIKESEIGLAFIDDRFSKVLTCGNYFHFNGFQRIEIKIFNLENHEETNGIDHAILMNMALAPYVKNVKIESFETGLLTVDGKFLRKLSGGNYFFWNMNKNVEVIKVDTRISHVDIAGQELLTKDKAALRLNFQMEYKVVDEQRVGPYKFWHHQHLIEPHADGVLMTDIITYIPPFGFLGDIANTLIIKNKLHHIFDYRQKALEDIFGVAIP